MGAQALLLTCQWAMGDSVCMSALVRDIQRAYPGKYKVYLTGHYLSTWKNNPHCEIIDGKGIAAFPAGKLRVVKLDYRDGIKEASKGKKMHFLSYFHTDFKKRTGIEVPVTEPKGDIHLSPKELEPIYPFRYWVVVAGGKSDMTTKIWRTVYFQEVVNSLKDKGIACVQAGAKFARHYHPTLQNCVSSVGKTDDVRDLYRLIYHSDGVICGITGAMHIAAAFEKPCVVIAGGREEPWWEGYLNNYFPTAFGASCRPVRVPHVFLHTVGLLDCGCGNLVKGCWKDRTVAVERSDHANERSRLQLCRKPLRVADQTIPECMSLVQPRHVLDAVDSYYEQGILPCMS